MANINTKPIYTRRFWAKAHPYGRPGPERIHLLEHHLADVGACFEALLAQPTIRRRLAHSGGMATLDDETAARLALFAAMHDVGKVNLGFQTRVWRESDFSPGERRTAAMRGVGHYRELVPVLLDDDTETAGWFFDKLDWWDEVINTWGDPLGETVCGLFVATLSHHGRPLQLEGGLSANSLLWRQYGDLEPREQVARVGGLLRRWFPAAFTGTTLKLPAKPQFQHMFLGLCTWADWIGSDKGWFPYVDEPDDDYFFEAARPRAAHAIREIGLDVRAQRDGLTTLPDFKAVFGFGANAIQDAALDAPLKTPVVIVESETGSGKTEAALWRFAHMYEQGLVDGIYFALPTRAAAVQIHGRVKKFVAKLFPNNPPPVVLAVPGYDADADAASVAIEYDEGAAGHQRDGRPWASEHPKRYLAAQIAVGTVDQAMMGALKVRHAHMRAACLARNLLVVDEVHASDTYMGAVLESLLDAHAGAGGYALLMSATLGSAARHRWLNRGRRANREGPTLADAVKAPYPAVSGEGIGLTAAGLNDQAKRVSVEASPTMRDFADVARRALDAARKGAKVLVVRNTVDYAVNTQLAIEELAGDADAALLFDVNGKTSPHHGRYAACDRKLLDARIEELLGKGRPHSAGSGQAQGGVVVVGTQTLEQSLDIDADLLIADLCPADVLLQRIGRLHRHRRDDRPDGYAAPRCIVLAPPDDGSASGTGQALSPLLASGENANGLGPHGYVYRDLRVLEATLRLVRERGEWLIPQMNRELVEGATHPKRLAAIVAELGTAWQIHTIDLTGIMQAEEQFARSAVVRRDMSFYGEDGEDNYEVVFDADENEVRTRLGDDRVDIALDPSQPSPFDRSRNIDKLAVTMRWLVGVHEPESVVPTPTDGGFTFSVGDRRFVYDRLGLRQA